LMERSGSTANQDRPCRNTVELGTRRVAGVRSAYGASHPLRCTPEIVSFLNA
jgi:hypothetical protein